MSEERIKERCKREDIALKVVKGFLEKDCYTDTELEYSLNTLLDLYNKQQKEIERLKNDKKKALNYINQEMYVDTNPTICEMEDEENSIIELPISLNLYNEDLRKLFDLLEEE